MMNRKNYKVPKPKSWTIEYVINSIGILFGITLIIAVLFALIS